MDIKLKNIGIVKDSNIKLDGLTVITGQNNSGKTTVGKVIYSLIDAVSNLPFKAAGDKMHYIFSNLYKIRELLDAFRLFITMSDQEQLKCFADYPAIINLFSQPPQHFSTNDIYAFAHKLREELYDFNIDAIDSNNPFFKTFARFRTNSHNFDDFKMKLDEDRKKGILIIDKLFKDIDKDPELIDYARQSINQTLKVEFSDQIQPIKMPEGQSEISVTDKETMMFSLNIENNEIIDDKHPVFFTSPYKKAYFIDNPFVLDSHPYRNIYTGEDMKSIDSFLDTDRIVPHELKLLRVLKSSKSMSVFEETVKNSGLKEIQDKINEVMPGEYEFSSNGDYYIFDGAKLQFTNLATGSKMFSILKILIDKGEIDEDTLLVLDEPEAHLHPSWQNKFAEIIVLLVKYFKSNILLTSHSPNFVLAIDAYIRKHHIEQKTNFYQTTHLDDGFVEYKNVNNDIGLIYSDFMQYLSEVKVLRDKYYFGESYDE